jgi:TonB-dependent heme/hemoglobin receptor
MLPWSRQALFLAIAAALSAPLGAQPKLGEEEARLLDRIQVTATRRPEASFDVPVAITVVAEREIAERAPQVAMDLLHGEPGTFVQQTTPGQGIVIVRGLKGSEVLHLVDGFRLNTAFFRNAPNQYMALVDSQMLERIEVVRGPSGTLYGSDAMGGVVQLLSAEPRFAGPERQSSSRVRMIYGSADHSLLSRVSGAVGNQDWVLSGGATYQDVGELRVGGGAELPFTHFTARAADAKLRWRVAEDHEFMVQAQVLTQPRTPRHDELVPGFGQTQPGSAVFYFEPQERQFAQTRWRWNAGLAAFDSLEVHLGYQKIRDDRRTRDFGSNNEDRERNASELIGLTAQFDKQFGRHHLSYGAEYYTDEISSFRQRTNVVTGVVSARPSRFPDGSTMDSFAIYVADDFQVSAALDVYGGLRWTRSDVELPPVIGGIGIDISPSDLSGNLGARFGLSAELNLVANYGRGFRAPNIFDLGTFGDRPGNRFNIPNPDLRSETVDTVDLGCKWSSERMQAELLGFVSRYRDKITSVLTGEVTASGRLVTQSRNVTELDLHGIEAGLRWFIDPTLSAYATVTYTRGEEQFGGDEYPADRIPPLFGKAGLSWRASDALTLEGYTFYAGRQDRLSPRDAVDPRINPEGTAGWATLNVRASWQASEALSLSLRAENLADKRYREHGSGLDEPGRNLILTLDWRR